MLACPPQCSIAGVDPVLAYESFGLALEMRDECVLVGLPIIRVHAVEPVLAGSEFVGREGESSLHPGRVVDLVGCDVPVVYAFVDRFHRQRVAFLAIAQCLLHSPTFGNVDDRTLSSGLPLPADTSGDVLECDNRPILTQRIIFIMHRCYPVFF